VCDRKTDLLLQIWHYLRLLCHISVVPVQYTMKVMRPPMYSCYCVSCGSSCKFPLCKVAIMGLLISDVKKGKIFSFSLKYSYNCAVCVIKL